MGCPPPKIQLCGEGGYARSTLVMGLVNSNQGVQGQRTLIKHCRITHNITKRQTEAGSMHSVPCVAWLLPREFAWLTRGDKHVPGMCLAILLHGNDTFTEYFLAAVRQESRSEQMTLKSTQYKHWQWLVWQGTLVSAKQGVGGQHKDHCYPKVEKNIWLNTKDILSS